MPAWCQFRDAARAEHMKREAEATWAAERVENALLRERINDVAAEVARLTSVLEGPGSRIDAILAEETPAGNGGIFYLDGKGVLAIEWAEKFHFLLPAETRWVQFRIATGGIRDGMHHR